MRVRVGWEVSTNKLFLLSMVASVLCEDAEQWWLEFATLEGMMGTVEGKSVSMAKLHAATYASAI
eukprot:5072659-Amphidinium_carterae.1